MTSPEDRTRQRAADLAGELPAFVAEAVRRVGVDESDTVVAALEDLGVAGDEARQAVRDGRVPLVLVQQVLGERRPFTLEQLADESGVSAEVLQRCRAAIGLPPTDRYGDTDFEWARGIARLLEVMPVEAVVSGARGRGQAVWSAAMSDLSIMRDELLLPMRAAGADDLTVGVALAETARQLWSVSSSLLTATYQLVTEHLLGSEVAALAASSGQEELDLAIGFVDVVGYTALSARIDPSGLDDVLDAFEDRILDVVADADDVAVVKYLGDAVMLVAADPVRLADTMLDLVEPHAQLRDAPLRGGLAAGPTRVREGDYYGVAVNMAARLTDHARAWSVLADEERADQLAETFEVRRLRPTRVRGFGLRRPVVVRRPDGPG